jgi:hypothetical protein
MRPIPHPRIIAACLGLVAAAPLTAEAQSLAAIRSHIAGENPGCDVARLEEAYRGALPGAAGHVVIAAYTVEGCGGGNNWVSQFGVFSEEGGRVVEYAQPDPPSFVVEHVRVANAVIEVDGKAYAATDGRCCPSVSSNARLRVEGRRVVPAN